MSYGPTLCLQNFLNVVHTSLQRKFMLAKGVKRPQQLWPWPSLWKNDCMHFTPRSTHMHNYSRIVECCLHTSYMICVIILASWKNYVWCNGYWIDMAIAAHSFSFGKRLLHPKFLRVSHTFNHMHLTSRNVIKSNKWESSIKSLKGRQDHGLNPSL